MSGTQFDALWATVHELKQQRVEDQKLLQLQRIEPGHLAHRIQDLEAKRAARVDPEGGRRFVDNRESPHPMQLARYDHNMRPVFNQGHKPGDFEP